MMMMRNDNLLLPCNMCRHICSPNGPKVLVSLLKYELTGLFDKAEGSHLLHLSRENYDGHLLARERRND